MSNYGRWFKKKEKMNAFIRFKKKKKYPTKFTQFEKHLKNIRKYRLSYVYACGCVFMWVYSFKCCMLTTIFCL